MVEASELSMSFIKNSFLDLKRFFIFCYTSEDSNKASLFALFFIVIVGALIRVAYLSQPMRYDESYTYVSYAADSIFHALSYYNITNNHIFNSLLITIITDFFGNSPEVIRIPVFFFGVLSIPLAYSVALKMYGQKGALIAAAFTAASSALIEYSTNARGYTYVIDMTLLSFMIAFFLRENNSIIMWLALAIVAAIGFHAMPIMLYSFGSVGLWMLLTALFNDIAWNRTQFILRLFASCFLGAILTVLLYSPILLAGNLSGSLFINQDIHPKSLSYLIANLGTPVTSAYLLWFRDNPLILSILLVAGVCLSWIFHKKMSVYAISIQTATIGWLIILLAIHRVVPYPRVLLYLAPLILITAAGSLGYLCRYIPGKKSIAVLSVLLAVGLSLNVYARGSILTSTQTGAMPDAKKTAEAMIRHTKPNACIVTPISGVAILRYYYFRQGVPTGFADNCKPGEKQFWVVTNGIYDETPEYVVTSMKMPFDLESYKTTLVESFDTSKLYRLDKK